MLDHLRWLNGPFAAALHHTLREPVLLLPLADAGLMQGDDCHGKRAGATAALAATLAHRPSVDACTAFLRTAPSFFLNLWMAASRCMLQAAAALQGFNAPAAPPSFSQEVASATRALPAIGDSAMGFPFRRYLAL